MSWKSKLKKLEKPFQKDELQLLLPFKKASQALLTPTLKALLSRLDKTFGAKNWQEDYTSFSSKKTYTIKCTLTIQNKIREGIARADNPETASFLALFEAARKWGLAKELPFETYPVTLRENGTIKQEKKQIEKILEKEENDQKSEKIQYENILIQPVTHLSKAALYIKYFSKRFPIVLSILLACGFFLPGYFLAGKATHLALPFSWENLLLGLFTILLFMLQLRIFDEHKDFVADQKNHPGRILSKGLITLSGLRKILAVVLWLQFTLVLFLPFSSLIGWLFLIVYSLLMLKEFFLPRFLNKHITLYMFSHQLIIFLFVLFAMLQRISFAKLSSFQPEPLLFVSTLFPYLIFWLAVLLFTVFLGISSKMQKQTKKYFDKPFLRHKLTSTVLLRLLALLLGIGIFLYLQENYLGFSILQYIPLVFLIFSLLFIIIALRTPTLGNFKALKLMTRLFFWTGLISECSLVFSSFYNDGFFSLLVLWFNNLSAVTASAFFHTGFPTALLFAFSVILLTMSFEVARKTRSKDLEKPTGNSYTKALGIKGAILLGQSLGLGAVVLFYFFLKYTGAGLTIQFFHGLFYVFFLLQGVAFLRTPIRGNSKALGGFALLYLLGTLFLSILAFV